MAGLEVWVGGSAGAGTGVGGATGVLDSFDPGGGGGIVLKSTGRPSVASWITESNF